MVRLICTTCDSEIVVADPEPSRLCDSCGRPLHESLGSAGSSAATLLDDDLLGELRDALHVEPIADGASIPPTLASIGHASGGVPIVEPLHVGTCLADFEIVEEIGRGGMGVVYRAWQRSLGRQVALKVLPAYARHGRTAVRRFRTEARAAAMLNHTNVVPVFAQGEHEGHYFYAMKLIEGVSLDAVIRAHPEWLSSTHASDMQSSGAMGTAVGKHRSSRKALSSRKAVGADDSGADLLEESHPARTVHRSQRDYRHIASLMAGVADGLAHAHGNGVIHRDIKPHNLLFGPDFQLYITDFGLAYLTSEPHVTITGEVIGTPTYLSPEQARGDVEHIDARTDVFSTGVTLYEMVTGRLPFAGSSREKVLHAICHDEARRPRLIEPHIPLDLETICLRSIEKTPSKRYASANALAEDLRRFAEGRPILSRRITAIERAYKWVRRRKAAAAVVGLGLIVGLVASGWMITAAASKRREAQNHLDKAYDRLVHQNYRKPDAAENDITQAVANGASGPRLQVVLTLQALGRGQPDEALRISEESVLEAPDDAELQYLHAWVLAKAKQPVRSQQVVEDADITFAASELSAEAMFFRALAWHRIDPDDAIEDYREAIRRTSEENQYFAQAALQLARVQNQIIYSSRSVELVPDTVSRLEQVAETEYFEAFPHYLLAIVHRLAAEIEEERRLGYGEKESREHYAKSLAAAENGILADPEDDRPYATKAMCLQRQGRFDEALDARTKAIARSEEKNLQRCENLHYRWRLHYWLGKYDAAMEDIDQRLKDCFPADLDSDLMREHRFYSVLYKALIEAERGRVDEALAMVRVFVEDAPRDDWQASLFASLCLRLFGKENEATEMLQERWEDADFTRNLVPPYQTTEWAEALYAFAARKTPFETLKEHARQGVTADKPWKLLGEAHFHAGAIALAARDRERALDEFEQAYRSFDGWVDYTFHGRLLSVMLAGDPAWPRWIPADAEGEEAIP